MKPRSSGVGNCKHLWNAHMILKNKNLIYNIFLHSVLALHETEKKPFFFQGPFTLLDEGKTLLAFPKMATPAA